VWIMTLVVAEGIDKLGAAPSGHITHLAGHPPRALTSYSVTKSPI